ncbi:hypothetical protein QL285_021040 [Trifolium repens]|nr:hypothetical protein QL285_021040 [Trifolium repens]
MNLPTNKGPQNIPNYGFPPNFITSSSNPNYRPHYGSMMSYSSQAPPYYPSTPTGNEKNLNVGLHECPEFSTQMTLSNFQKIDAYWGKITDYCNEHCSFDPPRDGVACRNNYNYMNKILNKWTDAYDNAKRMQQSGWSENNVLAKAQEVYSNDKSVHFNLMSEWFAVRDHSRYCSQVGGNIGSGSSGSKRAHKSDVSDYNCVGSNARPMGMDAANKKGKKKSKGATLESVNEECNEFKQYKEKDLTRLDKRSTT